MAARVSVIIPARNARATLAETLDSVIAQTYGDWEAIVADDGSSDGTGELAAGYHPRVECVRSPRNLGIGAARNLALTRAMGELVALLDADDIWLPQYLERQIARYDDAVAAGERIGIVCCDAYEFGPEGPREGTSYQRNRWVDPVTLTALLRKNTICVSSIVPRELIDELGGFATDCLGTEDYDMWLRILRDRSHRARRPRAALSIPRRRHGRIGQRRRHGAGDAGDVSTRAAAGSSRCASAPYRVSPVADAQVHRALGGALTPAQRGGEPSLEARREGCAARGSCGARAAEPLVALVAGRSVHPRGRARGGRGALACRLRRARGWSATSVGQTALCARSSSRTATSSLAARAAGSRFSRIRRAPPSSSACTRLPATTTCSFAMTRRRSLGASPSPNARSPRSRGIAHVGAAWTSAPRQGSSSRPPPTMGGTRTASSCQETPLIWPGNATGSMWRVLGSRRRRSSPAASTPSPCGM